MEYVRQIIDSDKLHEIPLPESFNNKKVEVIIFPIEEEVAEKKPKKTIRDFAGILNEYANPDLVPLEKEAWKMAVMEKHGSR